MRSLKGKSVLVTGGAGFIGSHVVDRLIKEKPSHLVVVDNLSSGKERNLTYAKEHLTSLPFYKQDICNFSILQKIIKKHSIDTVFHLAVKPLPESLIKPALVFDNITQGTLNLCELARKDAFTTLINTSSSEVYGTAQYVPMDEKHPLAVETPYAAAKAAADLLVQSYVRTFDIRALTVRPFNTYGPRQNEGNYAGVIPITLNRTLAGKKPIIFGDGMQTRDFMFVKDTAEAFVQVYRKGKIGEVYNFATGKETTIKKLITTLSQLLGYMGKIQYAPERPADVKRHLASVTKAKKQFGFTAGTSLAQGLQTTVTWYQRFLGE